MSIIPGYSTVWSDAFQLFKVMMQSAWSFFSIPIPGTPLRIWMLFVFVILLCLSVNFVRSMFTRDGEMS